MEASRSSLKLWGRILELRPAAMWSAWACVPITNSRLSCVTPSSVIASFICTRSRHLPQSMKPNRPLDSIRIASSPALSSVTQMKCIFVPDPSANTNAVDCMLARTDTVTAINTLAKIFRRSICAYADLLKLPLFVISMLFSPRMNLAGDLFMMYVMATAILIQRTLHTTV